MQLNRAIDMKQMPWKNGGGITAEVAISPAGTSLAEMDFDWRVSIATVVSDGPFSLFPGYDRLLVVWSGAGFDVGGIRRSSMQAFHFRGEDTMDVRLFAGAVKDFGIIFKRDRVQSEMSVHSLQTDEILPVDVAGECFVLCARGEIRIGEFYLNPGDVLRAGTGPLPVTALESSSFVVLQIR
ncbi:MAG TPA: HutD family protein [Bdellovibrionales bacterium]|nr:HutD family protein [Bdellovibrionales bacterium]